MPRHYFTPLYFGAIVAAALVFFVSCSRPAVNGHGVTTSLQKSQNDTVIYTVSFATPFQRQTFLATFEDFIKRYPFDMVRRGTGSSYYRLEVVPLTVAPGTSGTQWPLEQLKAPTPAEFARSVAANASDSALLSQVVTDGFCTVYAPRGLDEMFVRALLEVAPLRSSPADSSAPLIALQNTMAGMVTITLDTSLSSGTGQKLSGFEFAEAINRFVRLYPAQGTALFGAIKGVHGLVKGSEAVISGITIKSAATMQLTMQPGTMNQLPFAESMRAIPHSLSLGRYYIQETKAESSVLSGNQHYRGMRPLLARCVVKWGVDNNPFVSFSLNRYNVLVLWRADDCDYARRNLSATAVLLPYEEDRYFVRITGDSLVRRTVCAFINPAEIMATAIKGDVRPLDRIESDQISEKPLVFTPAAIRLNGIVLYNGRDDASRSIAEKIALTATRLGHSLVARGLQDKAFETALLNHAYVACVGYAGSKILESRSEQLHLAHLFFDGNSDEGLRIEQMEQVTLCSIKRYLLCNKSVAFLHDELSGIYIRKPGE